MEEDSGEDGSFIQAKEASATSKPPKYRLPILAYRKPGAGKKVRSSFETSRKRKKRKICSDAQLEQYKSRTVDGEVPFDAREIEDSDQESAQASSWYDDAGGYDDDYEEILITRKSAQNSAQSSQATEPPILSQQSLTNELGDIDLEESTSDESESSPNFETMSFSSLAESDIPSRPDTPVSVCSAWSIDARTGNDSFIPCNVCERPSEVQLKCLHVVCQACVRVHTSTKRCPACMKDADRGLNLNDNVEAHSIAGFYTWKRKFPERHRLLYHIRTQGKASFTSLNSRQKKERHETTTELIDMLSCGNTWNGGTSDEAIEHIGNSIAFLEYALDAAKKRKQLLEKSKGIDTVIGKGPTGKISKDLDLAIRMSLNLSHNQMRELKRLLALEHMDVFPAWRAQERLFTENALGDIVEYETFKVWSEEFNSGKTVNAVRVVDVQLAIKQYIVKTTAIFPTPNSVVSGDVVWLKLGTDRGRGVTKVVVNLLNRPEGQIESTFNFLVLAAYTADDNAKCLRRFVPEVFSQFDSMESIELYGKIVEIKKVVSADMKCMSSIMGLKGPASTRPCNQCIVSRETLRNGAGGTIRSQELYQQYSKVKGPTADNLGFIHKPLLSFDSTVQGFAALHNLQPAASLLYRTVEQDAIKISVALSMNEKISDETFKDAYTVATSAIDAKVIKRLLAKLEKALHLSRTPSWSSSCGPHCIYTGKQEALWIECEREDCLKWDHVNCSGLSHIEVQDSYTCIRCTGNFEVIKDRLKERLKEALEYDKYREAVDGSKTHPVYKKFAALSHGLHIKWQRYFGGILTGNDCHRFLVNKHKFMEPYLTLSHDYPITNDEKEALERRSNNLDRVLKPLCAISNLCVARMLTDDEVKVVVDSCAIYKKAIKLLFPNYVLRPKDHMLIYHLPKFVSEYKSIGIFAEQGCEAMHKRFSNAEARFSNRGDELDRLEDTVRAVNNQNIVMYSNKYAYTHIGRYS